MGRAPPSPPRCAVCVRPKVRVASPKLNLSVSRVLTGVLGSPHLLDNNLDDFSICARAGLCERGGGALACCMKTKIQNCVLFFIQVIMISWSASYLALALPPLAPLALHSLDNIVVQVRRPVARAPRLCRRLAWKPPKKGLSKCGRVGARCDLVWLGPVWRLARLKL